MNKKLNNNVVMAVCHRDEGGLPHLHLDIIPITKDCRLSSKDMITKDFIKSVHRDMPNYLRYNGFDIDEYQETEETRTGGKSAKEYKKKMEEENRLLNHKLDELAEEYNKLVDSYNNLVEVKKELSNNNYNKAVEIVERENHKQVIR